MCAFPQDQTMTAQEGKEKERVRESKEGSSVGFNGATEAITSVTTSPRAREKWDGGGIFDGGRRRQHDQRVVAVFWSLLLDFYF